MPFVWYGISAGRWYRLLQANDFDITLNRLPNIVGVSLLSGVVSTVSRISEALFGKRAEATEIIPPVFVLGHWRTGTTFLHNLLTCDPRNAFPTTFQCMFPRSFLISEHTIGLIFSAFLPSQRPMDDIPVGRHKPFEDEFALAKLGLVSPYRALATPDRPPDLRHLDLVGISEAERQAWDDGFLWYMRRLQFDHPGRRLVLKSPPHTARIGALLKLFPDARFVHIARNPFETFASTINLWKVLNSRLGLRNPPDDDRWLPEYVLSALPRMYQAYERDLPLVKPDRITEIRYEEFVTDPLGTLQQVYKRLGLGEFAPAREASETYLSSLGDHKGAKWQLSQADRDMIAARWGGYFERFGYDAGTGAII